MAQTSQWGERMAKGGAKPEQPSMCKASGETFGHKDYIAEEHLNTNQSYRTRKNIINFLLVYTSK